MRFFTNNLNKRLYVGFYAGALAFFAASAYAQNTSSVRGKVASVTNQEITVSTSNGGTVKAVLTHKTVIRSEVPVKLSDIQPGMYLGTTATKQPDGTFLASEVHIFSDDQRGTGEGHRPLGSAPQSGATMTNANVERAEDIVVNKVKGRRMNLKYKGGEVTVFVPPNIPIVKRVIADRSALANGVPVSLQVSKNDEGALSVVQITVRASGR